MTKRLGLEGKAAKSSNQVEEHPVVGDAAQGHRRRREWGLVPGVEERIAVELGANGSTHLAIGGFAPMTVRVGPSARSRATTAKFDVKRERRWPRQDRHHPRRNDSALQNRSVGRDEASRGNRMLLADQVRVQEGVEDGGRVQG